MADNKNIPFRLSVFVLMILLAAFSRLLPHPPNFTPVGAMALFGAAYFTPRFLAFLVPLVSLWLSDLVLSNVVYQQYYSGFTWFYPGFLWIFGSFVAITCVGFLMLKNVKVLTIVPAALLSSVLFFLISNFGTWFSDNLYTHDFDGLITCYVAAIPFFANTMSGDLFYSRRRRRRRRHIRG